MLFLSKLLCVPAWDSRPLVCLSCPSSAPPWHPSVLLSSRTLLKAQLQPHLPGLAVPGPGQRVPQLWAAPVLSHPGTSTAPDKDTGWHFHLYISHCVSPYSSCSYICGIKWLWFCSNQRCNSMDCDKYWASGIFIITEWIHLTVNSLCASHWSKHCLTGVSQDSLQP